MKELENRVVVITGAASGIGRATARAFARHGARLHLVDIDGEGLARVAGELGAPARRTAAVTEHRLDCTDADGVEALAERIFASDGRVDVLHNNAGVCCGGPVEQITLADWRWSVDVNLWGVIHGVRAFVPRMIVQGGGGHIVNTASMAGLVGLPMVVPYCATKFAVVGLSEALGAELSGHGIRVTTVCPGAVRTNVMRSARLELPGRWQRWIEGAFDRGSSSPDRLADAIVEAVRHERSLLLWPGAMAPLWWLKRLSLAGYQRITADLAARALGRRKARS